MKKTPQAPKVISREAKRWWSKITEEYEIDDAAGLLLLQTAMEAFDRMRDAQGIIEKEGATILDRFDQTKSHPQLTVERDARSQMIMALKSLNLDLEPLTNRSGRPGSR